MRILYVSVHGILEYDELRLLRGLGHTVFPLGAYFGGEQVEDLRPALPWGEDDARLLDLFRSEGCRYAYGQPVAHTVLTKTFLDAFDLVLVMHDPEFLDYFWPALRGRAVAWRSIGQDPERMEQRLAPLRAEGLKIIRYAEVERRVPGYLGEDCLIHFGKYADDLSGWRGTRAEVLTFTHHFAQRYGHEYGLYRQAVEGLPALLGGAGNEQDPGSIGLVWPEDQLELLRDCRVYYYCAGLMIPYTLNFIEAWMMGIPVVALSDRVIPHAHRYSEIPHLIDAGRTGMIAPNPVVARSMLRGLLADPGMAAEVGAAGRARAIEIFGSQAVSRRWAQALPRLTQG